MDQDFLPTFLEESEDLIEQWDSDCIEFCDSMDIGILNNLFRVVHTLKGSSKAVGLDEFGQFIHQVEDAIKLVQNGEGNKDAFRTALLRWFDTAKAWLDAIRNQQPFECDKAALEQLYHSIFSGASVEEGAPSQPVVNSESSKKPKATNPPKKDDVIRVSASKCDQLLRSAGQISINASAIRYLLKQEQFDKSKLLDFVNVIEKSTDRLHNDTIAIRMQPLETFFKRLYRLAIDVSSSVNKKVKVSLEGTDVEVDKVVADRLMDPFVHIIRNAIDHGLEPPEERLASQKCEEGQLLIRAEKSSSGIKIIVKDDGKGIDPEIILKKAREKQLVPPDQEYSDQEAIRLIMKAGFSTKSEVSDLSGRGVGMDVVATVVEGLGGKLDIASTKGQGTEFKVSIPTNLTILDAFIISSEEEVLCILIQEVDEIIDLKSSPPRVVDGCRLIDLRGEVIPLVGIDESIRGNFSGPVNADDRIALVCRIDEQAVAFTIDKIHCKRKIMVSNNESSKEIFGFAGSAILDDFQPGMIVSLRELSLRYSDEFGCKRLA